MTTLARVNGAPDGIVRVWTDGDWTDKDVRKALRKYAAGQAHSLVGAAQNVRAGKVNGTPGMVVDYAPVERKAKATADPREAEIAALRAQLAALTGEAAPKATPAKADTFRERVIVPRAEARASAKCATCVDYGRIRLTPDKRGRMTFKTANGAATAINWQPCPACAKGKAEARKTA